MNSNRPDETLSGVATKYAYLRHRDDIESTAASPIGAAALVDDMADPNAMLSTILCTTISLSNNADLGEAIREIVAEYIKDVAAERVARYPLADTDYDLAYLQLRRKCTL